MKNVGNIDRLIRVVFGIGIFSLVFLLDGNWKWLALGGAIPITTAIIGQCLLYRVLGISTCTR